MKVRCTACGHVGEPQLKGSIVITVILLFFGFIPGVLYEVWRRSSAKVCQNCGHILVNNQDTRPVGKTSRNTRRGKQPMNIKLILVICGLVALSFLSLFFMEPSDDVIPAQQQTSSGSGLQTTTVSNPEAKIDRDAYPVYTQSSYPTLYNQVGSAGLQKIYQHDVESALVVAKRSDCDRVVYVGYSQNKMNYPSKLVSFVDCANGKRFFVSHGVIE